MLKKTQKEGTLRKSEENGRSIHLSTIVNKHCENVDLLSISTNVKVNYVPTLGVSPNLRSQWRFAYSFIGI